MRVEIRESGPAWFAGDGFEIGDTIWMAETFVDGHKAAAWGLTPDHARSNLSAFIRRRTMDNTAQADRKAADLLLQQQRDAYVQAKVDAHVSETGKKPTKKQTDEWAEKAAVVIP